MKKSMALFHIKNFHVMVQHVGRIWIVLWVSGSNESTGVTHFQAHMILLKCVVELQKI